MSLSPNLSVTLCLCHHPFLSPDVCVTKCPSPNVGTPSKRHYTRQFLQWKTSFCRPFFFAFTLVYPPFSHFFDLFLLFEGVFSAVLWYFPPSKSAFSVFYSLVRGRAQQPADRNSQKNSEKLGATPNQRIKNRKCGFLVVKLPFILTLTPPTPTLDSKKVEFCWKYLPSAKIRHFLGFHWTY